MQDDTGEGVMEALLEMADASKVGIKVYRDRIPIREETKIFSENLNFDPLWMISSGSLIISLRENSVRITIVKKKLAMQTIVLLKQNQSLEP
ncbi:unnamed protein product [marine sediment metagenome]|uniref:PurM-like C-terminal domain-containing protein n=1 Tax=marine sediment metagenome TaxID=412755 RepID=X1H3P7_9ZZZZ